MLPRSALQASLPCWLGRRARLRPASNRDPRDKVSLKLSPIKKGDQLTRCGSEAEVADEAEVPDEFQSVTPMELQSPRFVASGIFSLYSRSTSLTTAEVPLSPDSCGGRDVPQLFSGRPHGEPRDAMGRTPEPCCDRISRSRPCGCSSRRVETFPPGREPRDAACSQVCDHRPSWRAELVTLSRGLTGLAPLRDFPLGGARG